MNRLLQNITGMLFFLVYLSACGNAETNATDQTETDEGTETVTSSQAESQERGGIAVIPTADDGIFDQEDELGSSLEYQGEFQQGIRWNNGPNLNYLVLTTQQSGTFFEEGWKSELLMYHYLAGSEKPSLQKKFVDQASNIYSAVVVLPDQSKILDLGGDQKAPLFAYAICPDGLDPCEIHVSSIVDGKRYELKRMGDVDPQSFMVKDKASIELIPPKLRETMTKLLFSINLDQ